MTGSSVQSEKSLKNKGKIPVIIVMTCLAEGADQLCAETALEVLTEDHEVRERTEGNASVDSEPLRFFLRVINNDRKRTKCFHR